MKRITILLVSLLLVNSLFAQIKVHSSGEVAVGPSFTPSEVLHIKKSEVEMRLQRTSLYSHNAILFWPHTTTYSSTYPLWEFGTQASTADFRIWSWSGSMITPLTLKTNGRVGILKTSPAYALDVNGDIASYGVVISSDSRLKENIKPLNESLNKLKQVNGISFNLIKRDLGGFVAEDKFSPDSIASAINKQEGILADSLITSTLLEGSYGEDSISSPDQTGGQVEQDKVERTRYGVVAQELKEIFPELVDQTEEGYYSVDYIGLIPVLIEALKEQQGMIEEMQQEIDLLLQKTRDSSM